MKKNTRSLIAIVTILVLLFTMAGTVFAADQQLSTEETAIRVREIIELRTTNSETYLMSDGTRQCVVFSDDKYYETGNSLQLIDNSIVAESSSDKLAATGSSVSRYQNKANSHKTTFSGSGTPYISMEKDGYSVSFSPTVASATLSFASAASRSFAPASSNIAIGKVNDCAPLSAIAHTGSNTATYADVFTDTDLVYVVKNNALKEYIILNSDSAPNAFSFTYTMDGLTLQNVEGSLCFTDPKGTPIFTLGNLFAVDARGAYTEAVTYSYTTNAYTGTATVTVTLDEEYLSAADRAFPVVIDPTIMISSVYTADAFVSSYYPATNYYTGFHLRTGFDADYGIRRSYIKFNIPDTVPLDAVLYATLEVQKSYGSTPSVRAYRVTGNWSSSTIKWNNKPGYTLNGGSTTSSVQSNGVWYTMYVTNIVKAWANTSTPNYGFLLKDLIEDDPNHYALFYSSDCDDGYRPELCIYYNEARVLPDVPTNLRSTSTHYCIPCAITNIAAYWTLNGYSQFGCATASAQEEAAILVQSAMIAAGSCNANANIQYGYNVFRHEDANRTYALISYNLWSRDNAFTAQDIIDEIDDGRPVMLGFSSASPAYNGGHMTVCVGYEIQVDTVYVYVSDAHSSSYQKYALNIGEENDFICKVYVVPV